jgi:basic membrane protein A and related proteins
MRSIRRLALRPASTAVVTALALAITACGGGSDAASPARKVALLIPGTTGDGGFFDDSKAGVEKGASAAGFEPQVVEAGTEATKWQPAFEDLVAGDANPVITGTFAMTELVEQAAAQHPDKQFVLFDAAIDPKKCGNCTNVYSITYRYDQAGFLAGALAGLLETAPRVDKVARTGVVGVVGGQEIGVIEDYIAGFKAGVAAVAPKVRVLSAYANSFADPAQGKAVAEDMIAQGGEILFTAAGGTDKGVFEAAAAHGLWAIGNSAQQSASAKVGGTDTILSSASTDVESSIADAVTAAANGKLPTGQVASFGVKDESVRLEKTDLYAAVVPADVRTRMDKVVTDLGAGTYDSVLPGA